MNMKKREVVTSLERLMNRDFCSEEFVVNIAYEETSQKQLKTLGEDD